MPGKEMAVVQQQENGHSAKQDGEYSSTYHLDRKMVCGWIDLSILLTFGGNPRGGWNVQLS